MKHRIAAALVGLLLGLGLFSAQAQTLLPNGQQVFLDNNGAPLASGQVFFYVPGTTTPLTTYQNQSLTTPNTNPVILNAAGRAIIWGTQNYREVVYDQNGNLIWDQITSGVGSITPGSTACAGCTANYLLYTDGTKVQQEASATPGQGGKPSNRYTNFTTTSSYTTSSASFVMFGFGSTFTLTPNSTGKVRVRITAQLTGNTTANYDQAKLKYGTGSPPAAGDADTGTAANGSIFQIGLTSQSTASPATFESELSLTPGTTYWFDLAGLAFSGNLTMTPVSVIIEEF